MIPTILTPNVITDVSRLSDAISDAAGRRERDEVTPGADLFYCLTAGTPKVLIGITADGTARQAEVYAAADGLSRIITI